MDRKKNNFTEIASGVWGLKIVFVNIFMIAEDDQWILVDTGLPGSADRIISMAEELFGDQPPAAIILTHGHFDHRGAIEVLLEKWNVPVYAHQMELPYLQGKSSYPPADPTVGGGLMSLLSFLYPKRPIDLGNKIEALSANGSIPFLTSWLFIFTPGHTPGHISLFRSRDRVLIAGDAFVTTKQESALAILTSARCLSGPPKYFTPDWVSAKESVAKLMKLNPAIAATGHGESMKGQELTHGLERLVHHFEALAVPVHGRYVDDPAKASRRGVQYIPGASFNTKLALSLVIISGLVAITFIKKYRRS